MIFVVKVHSEVMVDHSRGEYSLVLTDMIFFNKIFE